MAHARSVTTTYARQLAISMIGQQAASRIKNLVFSLPDPEAWLRFLLTPVTAALSMSPRVYWFVSEALRRPGRNRRAVAPGPGADRVDQLVFEVNRDGASKWEGMFPQDTMAELRRHVEEVIATARARLDKLLEGKKSFVDEATGLVCHTTGVNTTRIGVKDVRQGYPDWLKPIIEDPRSLAVVSKYWGVKTRVRRLMFEEMTPDVNLRGGEWHIDVFNDQMKVWLLVNDVGPENGPTQYKLGTHESDHPNKILVSHNGFRHGDAWCYPGTIIANSIPGELAFVSGQAGDCFFFDTTGLHSRTPCREGKRLVMVLTYYIPTRRNLFFHLLKKSWAFPDKYLSRRS